MRRATRHTTLCSDDGSRGDVEALVLQVFDFFRECCTTAVIEERRNETKNVVGAVDFSLAAGLFTLTAMRVAVGHGMRTYQA